MDVRLWPKADVTWEWMDVCFQRQSGQVTSQADTYGSYGGPPGSESNSHLGFVCLSARQISLTPSSWQERILFCR